MLRIIFITIFFFIIAICGVWLSNYDFQIRGELEGYIIETSALKLFIIIIFLFFVFYGVLRFISWVVSSPSRILASRRKNQNERGYKDLMAGFSALASGDTDYAKKLASRAAKALENQPLVKLLQAQTASLSGNAADAEKFYSELSEIEGAKAIGYRGLIAQAIGNSEFDRALELSEDFLKSNPRSKWINEAVIDLSLRNNDYERCAKYVTKAYKAGVINKSDYKTYSSIIHYLIAKESYSVGRLDEAAHEIKNALEFNPKFLPAAILQAEILLDMEQYSKAQNFIEKFWKTTQHPQLANAYERIFAEEKAEKKLRKAARILKIEPRSIQSILLFARAAIEAGEKSKAEEELKKALSIRETKSVYELLAQLGNSAEWNERAHNAEEDKCWHCTETGARYSEWQPFSDSGNFNTIIWDYPQRANFGKSQMKNFLLIK